MTRCLLVISTFVLVVLLRYVHGAPVRESRQVASFLLRFGYLIEGNNSKSREEINPTSEEFQRSIKNLQRFANIPVTGRIDAATIQLINTDRCGVKDRYPNAVGEFKLQGTSWKKREITYKIISFTSDGIPRYSQRRVFRKAFNLWQTASDLRIREVFSGDADILISFVRQAHNDRYPFDGEGGTLAHAFYPHDNKGLSGDAHFDDDERFTTGTKDGINLDWVAVHEFGHSLGLEHSNVRESIMYPWYKGYVPNIQLTNDDVRGIQMLYPKPTKPIRTTPLLTTTTRPAKVTPRPAFNVCRSTFHYDTVFVDGNKWTYFFAGEYFWYLDRRLRRTGPLMIRRYWKHIRTPVDAAYLNTRGHVTFFKGSQFWEYSNRRTLTNSGTITRYGIPMDLANMDAVFTWEGNKKTYFFKGSKYWRYDEQTGRADTSRYPRNIHSAWKISHRFDAAVTWINGRSYIFRDRQYFKLRKGRVHLEPGYPKAIADGWMRCNSRGRLLVEALKSGDR